MNKSFDWPEKKIGLQDLLLDKDNHRLKFDRDIQLKTQNSIIKNLILHDNILSLAKQISEHGFVPVEKMIVLEKGEKYIVLEGNRRLAALKCLINPELAHPYSKKFKELGTNFPLSSIKKIPVFIAPNRKEALSKFIIPKHTEPSVKKWATYNKSKIYAKMILDQGKTVDDVCKSYNIKKDSVIKALRMYQCYEIATKLPLTNEVMDKVLDERKFPITTLDRLMQSKEGQKFLGIKFDKNGNLKGKIQKEEFIKRYMQIISDIAEKTATSRTLHEDKDKKSYLENIKKKPNLNTTGSFSFKSFNKRIISNKFKKPKNPKIRKTKLKDYRFVIPHESSILNKIYSEIESHNFYSKPYSFAIVFRTFLHLCCIQFSRKHNLFKKIKKSERNNNTKNSPDPTLGECLNYFKKKTTFQDKGIERSIADFINKQNNPNMTTLNTLNTLNHANTITISGENHSKMLDTLEQLLRKLLEEKNANS